MGEETTNHESIEVWMREHPTIDVQYRQQAALDRLTYLKDEGIINPFSVNTWRKHINTQNGDSPSNTATPAFDKALEFEHWSEQTGRDLPGFQRRTQSSLLTNRSREVFVTPILCLALYEDTDLNAVIPNSGPEEHRTVTEYLDSFTTTEKATDDD